MTALMWILGLPAIALVAIAAELGARWWIRRGGRYYVLPPGLRLRLCVDRNVFPQLEPLIRFDVNGDGERGDEPPRNAEGLYRILVAGGSTAEGYLLDQDTNWSGALQRGLASPEGLAALGASRVHVGNIARSFATAEALDMVMARVLPRYPRLQAIMIMTGASDVLRWLEHGAPATFPPVRARDVFRWHPEGPFSWKPSELALRELVLRWRQRWLRPVRTQERAGAWIERARDMRARATDVRTSVPDPSAMLAQFEVHFRRLVQRASAHADRVMVIPQPWLDKDLSPEEAAMMWHGGVGSAWNQDVTTYYSFDVVSSLMRLVHDRIKTIADTLDVEQVDVMPTLERSLRTYYDCFHLTPEGSRVIATAVGAAVLRAPAAAPREAAKVPAGGLAPSLAGAAR